MKLFNTDLRDTVALDLSAIFAKYKKEDHDYVAYLLFSILGAGIIDTASMEILQQYVTETINKYPQH